MTSRGWRRRPCKTFINLASDGKQKGVTMFSLLFLAAVLSSTLALLAEILPPPPPDELTERELEKLEEEGRRQEAKKQEEERRLRENRLRLLRRRTEKLQLGEPRRSFSTFFSNEARAIRKAGRRLASGIEKEGRKLAGKERETIAGIAGGWKRMQARYRVARIAAERRHQAEERRRAIELRAEERRRQRALEADGRRRKAEDRKRALALNAEEHERQQELMAEERRRIAEQNRLELRRRKEEARLEEQKEERRRIEEEAEKAARRREAAEERRHRRELEAEERMKEERRKQILEARKEEQRRKAAEERRRRLEEEHLALRRKQEQANAERQRQKEAEMRRTQEEERRILREHERAIRRRAWAVRKQRIARRWRKLVEGPATQEAEVHYAFRPVRWRPARPEQAREDEATLLWQRKRELEALERQKQIREEDAEAENAAKKRLLAEQQAHLRIREQHRKFVEKKGKDALMKEDARRHLLDERRIMKEHQKAIAEKARAQKRKNLLEGWQHFIHHLHEKERSRRNAAEKREHQRELIRARRLREKEQERLRHEHEQELRGKAWTTKKRQWARRWNSFFAVQHHSAREKAGHHRELDEHTILKEHAHHVRRKRWMLMRKRLEQGWKNLIKAHERKELRRQKEVVHGHLRRIAEAAKAKQLAEAKAKRETEERDWLMHERFEERKRHAVHRQLQEEERVAMAGEDRQLKAKNELRKAFRKFRDQARELETELAIARKRRDREAHVIKENTTRGRELLLGREAYLQREDARREAELASEGFLQEVKVRPKRTIQESKQERLRHSAEQALLRKMIEQEERRIREEAGQLPSFIATERMPLEQEKKIREERDRIRVEASQLVNARAKDLLRQERQHMHEIHRAMRQVKREAVYPLELQKEHYTKTHFLPSRVEEVMELIGKAREEMLRLNLARVKLIYQDIMRLYLRLSPDEKMKVHAEINELYHERKRAEALLVRTSTHGQK